MNRKETTEFLSELLIRDRLSGYGKYYAREVSIDAFTRDVKRVDFLQFEPAGVTSIGDIEKGTFTCYEVKSCKADVYSGNGLNFVGEKNYLVTTMKCYKEIMEDLSSGKFWKHIKECNPQSQSNVGIMVPIPWGTELSDEFEEPTEFEDWNRWEYRVVLPCRTGKRNRGMVEMLFYMLRSGK